MSGAASPAFACADVVADHELTEPVHRLMMGGPRGEGDPAARLGDPARLGDLQLVGAPAEQERNGLMTYDRVPKVSAMAAYAKQAIRDKLIEHTQYIATYGDDMPEIREWKWDG